MLPLLCLCLLRVWCDVCSRISFHLFVIISYVSLAMVLYKPSRRCLHFEVVGGLEGSNDPESYAGGSVATGRFSLAGQVEDDDPD